MSRKSELPAKKLTSAVSKLVLLGAASLLPGETIDEYKDLLARLSATICPADVIEEIWLRDIVDLTWDILRLRRLKAALVIATRYEGLQDVLAIWLASSDAENLAKLWAAGNANAAKKVKELLTSAGLTMEAADAHTLARRITEIERIDRMMMAAEARRNVTYREIGRHRDTIASAAERTVQKIEDAEFKVVESRAEKFTASNGAT